MRAKYYLAISVILTLVLLLLYSHSPKQVKISSLQGYKENSFIKTSGKVESSKKYQEFQILTLSDSTAKIEVLFPSNQNLTGKNIEVSGIIQKYKNKKQIRAEKILVIYGS